MSRTRLDDGKVAHPPRFRIPHGMGEGVEQRVRPLPIRRIDTPTTTTLAAGLLEQFAAVGRGQRPQHARQTERRLQQQDANEVRPNVRREETEPPRGTGEEAWGYSVPEQPSTVVAVEQNFSHGGWDADRQLTQTPFDSGGQGVSPIGHTSEAKIGNVPRMLHDQHVERPVDLGPNGPHRRRPLPVSAGGCVFYAAAQIGQNDIGVPDGQPPPTGHDVPQVRKVRRHDGRRAHPQQSRRLAVSEPFANERQQFVGHGGTFRRDDARQNAAAEPGREVRQRRSEGGGRGGPSEGRGGLRPQHDGTAP
mmetsp:Transcript_360/g.1060  ORF Transcript_360/g.1060 Transcript_360/m.1060 type:complete len:306 (-) Transcript_360:588-1505(-)